MEIYVGYIPWGMTDAELEEIFKKFGDVTRVTLPRDRFNDRPRGFGFVEMPNDEQAKAAIKALDGTELRDRRLKVNQALKPRRQF